MLCAEAAVVTVRSCFAAAAAKQERTSNRANVGYLILHFAVSILQFAVIPNRREAKGDCKLQNANEAASSSLHLAQLSQFS